MHKRIRVPAVAALFALATLGVTLGAQQRPAPLGPQQIGDLLRRIDAGIVTFRASVDEPVSRRRGIDRAELDRSVVALQEATRSLREGRRNRRGDASVDLDLMLERATAVDRLVASRTLSPAAQRDWQALRGDVDELARAHNLRPDWSTAGAAGDQRRDGREQRRDVGDRLTGTYQLDTTRGDESEQAVQQAIRQLRPSQRQAARDRLMRRLQAPETIVIERNRGTVTMASSRGRQVTFDADGQVRREEGPAGRPIETRAALTGDQLMVSTSGNRGTDFTVTFEPLGNTRTMRVTRRIQDDTLRQPISVISSYRKTSDAANWDMEGVASGAPSARNRPAEDRGVPDGTRIVGTLDNALTTRTSSAEDRFTITTRTPSEFEGAVIEGTISSVKASGRVAGRAEMALNFERIRLRNGRTYQFAGAIETARATNGDTIGVNKQGSVDDGSQTEKTVQRGAIGAALGAIIGAISGGGQGAAIGAAVGAGGGAGTVIAQGRDHLELPRGTEFTIISGAPRAESAAREQ
jgi:hypothetical protein